MACIKDDDSQCIDRFSSCLTLTTLYLLQPSLSLPSSSPSSSIPALWKPNSHNQQKNSQSRAFTLLKLSFNRCSVPDSTVHHFRPDQSVRSVIPDGIEDSSVFLTNATADQSLALALGLAFESLIAALEYIRDSAVNV
ncbi:hypothetical protein SDJN02_15222, partial [Cucurbita argyrosperma subsp. argyrosperma]